MKFEFFERLSLIEASEFLARFLELESVNTASLMKDCAADGIVGDFSISSIEPVFRWIWPKLKIIRKPAQASVPQWVRGTESYSKYLFDFDEHSSILVLRAAYYLGETFARSHPDLRWSVGRPDRALAKMPVITGFKFKLELPPLLVAENVFSVAVAEGKDCGEIVEAVHYWEDKIC